MIQPRLKISDMMGLIILIALDLAAANASWARDSSLSLRIVGVAIPPMASLLVASGVLMIRDSAAEMRSARSLRDSSFSAALCS